MALQVNASRDRFSRILVDRVTTMNTILKFVHVTS